MEELGKKWAGDLAKECVDRLGKSIPGMEEQSQNVGGLTVHRLRILTSEAAGQIGKPIGNYVTVCCGKIERMDPEMRRQTVWFTAGELRRMAQRLCGQTIGKDLHVLVAGLGNAGLTADALGTQTVGKLTVTGHLCEDDPFFFETLDCCALYATVPGVRGQTGTDASRLLYAVANAVSARLLVAVDSLAATGLDHLSGVVQLSDSGIVPGSGVGNHRTAITSKTMGIPVISIGVPTVVSSSSLVRDILQLAGIQTIDDRLRPILENKSRLYVTPGNCDETIRHASRLLADVINYAFAGRAAGTDCLS